MTFYKFFNLIKACENSQLAELFEKKYWDIFTIILDNSCNEEGTYDFQVLNPPMVSVQSHPLMLLAKSGQEILIKHPSTKTLLDMKWSIIPRFLFYFNIVLYFFHILLFSLFSMELTELNFANSEFHKDIDEINEIWTYYEYKSKYYYPIMTMIVIMILRAVIKILFSNGKTLD